MHRMSSPVISSSPVSRLHSRAHTVVRQVVIEKTIVVAQDAAQAETAPVRPKLMIIGGSAGVGAVSVLRPGHSCDGVLTLTWMGDHAEPHCNRSTSRLTRTGR